MHNNTTRHKSVGHGSFSPEMMPIPWVESPFFYQILGKKDLLQEDKDLAIQYHENGFVILDLELNEQYTKELFEELFGEEYKKLDQAKTYQFLQYTNYPRIFDGWRENNKVLELAVNKKVMRVLNMLYDREPMPFQTINFLKGSKQPLHSDIIHFNTVPEKWVAGAWLALEDMDEVNGTFMYVPGSHKLPIYEYPDIGINVPISGEQKDEYAQYEDFIEKLVLLHNLKKELFIAKRGQIIISSGNIIHGGGPITDENRTRFSQVTHYLFEGCKRYYCPMYSDKFEHKYADKKMETKDILGLAKSKQLI